MKAEEELDIQQRLTDMKRPCPECGELLLGARAWDAGRREMFFGLACRKCEQVYVLGGAEQGQPDDPEGRS